MPVWERALKEAVKGYPGWSARGMKGRVLVERRPSGGGPKESVLLPEEIAWSEQQWTNVIVWLNNLWAASQGGQIHLRPALNSLIVKSDQLGEDHASDWNDIKEAFRVRLMEGGQYIQQKTWESNYARYIDAAILAIKNHQLTDGPAVLRQTAKQWAKAYHSRAACVSTLKGFFEFAYRDPRYKVPETWLIDEFHAKPIRGEKPEKVETCALKDQEILQLLDAVQARWGIEWRSVFEVLTALGLRAFELELIEVRTNEKGEPQMWSTYRKAGGANRTKPRWLEEIPLTDDQGNKVWFDIAKRWSSMPWPKTRTGERRAVTAHYLGQYIAKVETWQEIQAKYAAKGERACPSYSFRNAWNTRARAAGLPDFAVTRSMGNSPTTNRRSYRQTTDELTREAFRNALGR